ncbi:MAG: primase, partial [Pedosphaera sp.]|nr:primase [Pedosphaera sp.]
HLDPGWVQHALVRQILLLRLTAHASQSWQGVAAFLSECESSDMRSLITEVTAEERPIPNPTQQTSDIALRLRNQFIDRQLAAMTQRSNHPGMTDAERLDLLRSQQALRQLKRQPLTPLVGSEEEPY